MYDWKESSQELNGPGSSNLLLTAGAAGIGTEIVLWTQSSILACREPTEEDLRSAEID